MSDQPKILGVNKRYLPQIDHSRNLPLMVVLVAGDIGDYAAYSALSEDKFFTARFGDKIRFEEACCHFPGGQLKKELYRD